VTAVIALLEPASGRVRWVNAGHPAPVVCGTDGAWRTLEVQPQMPLGLYEEDRRFACGEAVVAPGERLVLFSDGVTERRGDDGEQFGVSGLITALDDSSRAGVAVAVANLQNSVLKASTSPLSDDSTVLAAEIRPDA
jgi:serine phosphatase RsbU (regulator of sigma subunit)